MTVAASHLQLLCRLYGVNSAYQDMNGITREASPDALWAVLRALGAPLEQTADIPAAQRLKHLQDWQTVCPPVVVHWQGTPLTFTLRLPAYLLGSSIPVSLDTEAGETVELLWKIEPSAVVEQKKVEGSLFLTAVFRPALDLPAGYHRLKIDLPGCERETLVISAPQQAFRPPAQSAGEWGVFLPLYALHTHNSWGTGSYSDLKALLQWTSSLGGRVVGTLPLLAGFFDSHFGPGPYLPASKLFWNEFYLDIPAVPEFQTDPAAAELYNSPDFQEDLDFLRQSEVVLYEPALNLKRRLLENLARRFWSERPARFPDFEIYLANHPELTEYAHFRAAGEVFGLDWRRWPDPIPYQRAELRRRWEYHAYVQWLVSGQIHDLVNQTGPNPAVLYLDLPVGVHPFSYDVWKERDCFMTGVNCGAPPDPAFTAGQNWSFPPLHPQKIREQGYRYFIQCLRRQLKVSAMLRIDHMMNFHRLFWIPDGLPVNDGVYVNYSAEEFYALLTLESVRHQSVIIGEDLGLVPPEVRPLMEKHGIKRLFVGQFELLSDNPVGHIPDQAVAGLNTHDMYPFAAFWEETDITRRQEAGELEAEAARLELEERRRHKRALLSLLQYNGLISDLNLDTAAVLQAVLRFLAQSPAGAVLINLEDLWLEHQPQNVPGTYRPQNWSRRAGFSFEQFSRMPEVLRLLQEIDTVRRKENSGA